MGIQTNSGIYLSDYIFKFYQLVNSLSYKERSHILFSEVWFQGLPTYNVHFYGEHLLKNKRMNLKILEEIEDY